ncbi:MAG: efflux RND transporter permease subunit, partial [Muribaculaceae bacterium]|nr:efflux RND transporter permease subunit [Muribaculaceae bacterium]
MAGGSGSNLGSMFVMLKPWKDRKGKSHSVEAVMERVDERCASLQQGIVFAVNPPAIPGLGTTSGLSMQLLDINSRGASQMAKALEDIEEAARKDPRIGSVQSLYEGEVPQYSLEMQRDKIEMLGLDLDAVYSALS